MRIIEFHGEGEWIDAALGELRSAAEAARSAGSGTLSLCLAGGLTPEPAYRAMAGLPLAGLAAELWLGDERAVGADDPARNGLMVARSFADCAWEVPPRLRLWPEAAGEAETGRACARYEAELLAALGPRPVFDLAFLGLGADGHTASLFPGDARFSSRAAGPGVAQEAVEGRLAVPSRSPLPPFARMTLAPALLRAARRRVFLVKGEDKLPAVRKLEAEDPAIPASLLAGPGSIALYLASK
jgi:6-phosphogluconolactonase